tara:strand:+ start:3608 stop:5581 length:1974 start_codon:yes stop_codon:yes gene_type:complete
MDNATFNPTLSSSLNSLSFSDSEGENIDLGALGERETLWVSGGESAYVLCGSQGSDEECERVELAERRIVQKTNDLLDKLEEGWDAYLEKVEGVKFYQDHPIKLLTSILYWGLGCVEGVERLLEGKYVQEMGFSAWFILEQFSNELEEAAELEVCGEIFKWGLQKVETLPEEFRVEFLEQLLSIYMRTVFKKDIGFEELESFFKTILKYLKVLSSCQHMSYMRVFERNFVSLGLEKVSDREEALLVLSVVRDIQEIAGGIQPDRIRQYYACYLADEISDLKELNNALSSVHQGLEARSLWGNVFFRVFLPRFFERKANECGSYEELQGVLKGTESFLGSLEDSDEAIWGNVLRIYAKHVLPYLDNPKHVFDLVDHLEEDDFRDNLRMELSFLYFKHCVRGSDSASACADVLVKTVGGFLESVEDFNNRKYTLRKLAFLHLKYSSIKCSSAGDYSILLSEARVLTAKTVTEAGEGLSVWNDFIATACKSTLEGLGSAAKATLKDLIVTIAGDDKELLGVLMNVLAHEYVKHFMGKATTLKEAQERLGHALSLFKKGKEPEVLRRKLFNKTLSFYFSHVLSLAQTPKVCEELLDQVCGIWNFSSMEYENSAHLQSKVYEAFLKRVLVLHGLPKSIQEIGGDVDKIEELLEPFVKPKALA